MVYGARLRISFPRNENPRMLLHLDTNAVTESTAYRCSNVAGA